jgi:predicted ArsR family transcriptional regulator
MTKRQLLHYLSQHVSADAFEVAQRFELDYAAAAMALLRLTRQSLAARRLDPESGLYWYELTQQGQSRLRYFESLA